MPDQSTTQTKTLDTHSSQQAERDHDGGILSRGIQRLASKLLLSTVGLGAPFSEPEAKGADPIPQVQSLKMPSAAPFAKKLVSEELEHLKRRAQEIIQESLSQAVGGGDFASKFVSVSGTKVAIDFDTNQASFSANVALQPDALRAIGLTTEEAILLGVISVSSDANGQGVVSLDGSTDIVGSIDSLLKRVLVGRSFKADGIRDSGAAVTIGDVKLDGKGFRVAGPATISIGDVGVPGTLTGSLPFDGSAPSLGLKPDETAIKKHARDIFHAKVEELLTSTGLRNDFVEIAGIRELPDSGDLLASCEGDVMLKPELFRLINIEFDESIKIAEVSISIDSTGKIVVGGSIEDMDAALSEGISKALVGKSFKITGLGEAPLTGTIEKASYSDKKINVGAAVSYKVGGIDIPGAVSVSFSLSGGTPVIGLDLDKEALRRKAGKIALEKGGELLKQVNANNPYFELRNPRAIDCPKDEIARFAADVVLKKDIFKLIGLDVQEPVNIGSVIVSIDKNGRVRQQFDGADFYEIVSQRLSDELVGKSLPVLGEGDRSLVAKVLKVTLNDKGLGAAGTVVGKYGGFVVGGTLEGYAPFNGDNPKVDVRIDDSSLREIAKGYLTALLPDGCPLSDVRTAPDPAGKGTRMWMKVNLYGGAAEIENVLVTPKGDVSTDEATIKFATGVVVSFGWVMLSEVNGGYNFKTREITAGGKVTLGVDPKGLIVSLDGVTVFSLKDPSKLVTKGDLTILKMPAGNSETIVDLKNGTLTSEVKMGNGITKLEGRAVIQAPLKDPHWYVQIDKARLTVLDCKMVNANLRIDESGARARATAAIPLGNVDVGFTADKDLSNAKASFDVEQKLKVKVGKYANLVDAHVKAQVEVYDGGVKVGLDITTPFKPLKGSLRLQGINQLTANALKEVVEKELDKLAGVDKQVADWFKDREEAVRNEIEKNLEKLTQPPRLDPITPPKLPPVVAPPLPMPPRVVPPAPKPPKIPAPVRDVGEKAKEKVEQGARAIRGALGR